MLLHYGLSRNSQLTSGIKWILQVQVNMAIPSGRSLAGIAGSNPVGVWKSVCCDYCVLSGRILCDKLIPLPEETYQLWCVIVCVLETTRMRRPWPALGCCAVGSKGGDGEGRGRGEGSKACNFWTDWHKTHYCSMESWVHPHYRTLHYSLNNHGD